MNTTFSRKLCSVLLSFMMLLSIIPVPILAAAEDAGQAASPPTYLSIIPDAPTDGSMVSVLSNGEIVAIFNDANGKALTAVASGRKLAGTDAVLDEMGKLIGEGIAPFTVALGDGYVSFLSGGKYLTSGPWGNLLTLADEESGLAHWIIEYAGGGLFYLKNAEAIYNDKPQYFKFYKGFTTYEKIDFDPRYDLGDYAMSFRKLRTVGTEPPAAIGLSDGDTVDEGGCVVLDDYDADVVYYTTDGTDPRESESREEYMEPVVLTETVTFRAVAYTEEGGYSDELVLHLTVGASNPTEFEPDDEGYTVSALPKGVTCVVAYYDEAGRFLCAQAVGEGHHAWIAEFETMRVFFVDEEWKPIYPAWYWE